MWKTAEWEVKDDCWTICSIPIKGIKCESLTDWDQGSELAGLDVRIFYDDLYYDKVRDIVHDHGDNTIQIIVRSAHLALPVWTTKIDLSEMVIPGVVRAGLFDFTPGKSHD